MTAYYNEHDEFAASWLRNLIAAGLIADGEVDTRSIVDVRPGDLVAFKQCHFFAGIGGWSYALRQAGWPDASPVWTGSCPCQPFSLAGAQRGFNDERHLWPVWRELIRECSPAIVFGEQVASATEWLGLVRGDLEAMEYAVGAMPIQAAGAGADHLRDRYWFVAHSDDARSQGRGILPERASERAAGTDGLADADSNAIRIEPGRSGGPRGASVREHRNDSEVCPANANELGDVGHTTSNHKQRLGESSEGGRREGQAGGSSPDLEWVIGADGKARRVKPGIRLLAHGIPNRVGLLRGFGNAIDHRPAAAFIAAARDALALSSQEQS